ncbi:MAG: hypothetical protein Hens2KO_22110 [Henriciella sp.]
MSTDSSITEKSTLEKLIEEQLTPRTQYGLVVLFIIAIIYTISGLMDYVSDRASEAQAANSELEIWSDSDAQDEWRARAETTTEALAAWEAAAWQAASPGIAAAEIEIAINSLAAQSGVPTPRIDVNSEAALQQSSDFLRFDVSGSIAVESVPRLLVLLAAHQKHLIVTDVQLVTRNQSATNFQLSGVAPFKRNTEGTTE